ncbi:precorrin-6y C5,15-methyltransferase (decarboxylating) subunit CbiE [Thermodesulfobacteriota bacterium]
MNKVHIVGTGPGSHEYLLPIAKRLIEEADCLIGAERLLKIFDRLDTEKVELKGNLKDVIPYIKENRQTKKIVVLVSGDPGIYSLSSIVRKSLKRGEYEVIPGISSMQLAFSKIGESWQDAIIISLHGRRHDNFAEMVKGSKKVFLLTDPAFPANEIAKHLLESGVTNKSLFVLENLSYKEERVIETDLEALSKMSDFSSLCVMIILDNEGA